MARERLIDDVRCRERGTDTGRQQQLEAVRRAFRRVIRRSRHQPADGDLAERELAFVRFGANAKTTAAPWRRLLTTLARKPLTESVVRNCRRAHRRFIAVESDEPNGSTLDPTDFAIAVVQPKAAITMFEDAQRHDPGD